MPVNDGVEEKRRRVQPVGKAPGRGVAPSASRAAVRLLASFFLGALLPGCSATLDLPHSAQSPATSTPDAELRAIASNPSGRGFAMTTEYSLHAVGLPPGRDYRVELRRADGSASVAIDPASVANNGEVRAPGGGPGQTVPAVLRLGGMAPGEPLVVAVDSRDGTTRATTTVVPRPVEATGVEGCRLGAELERRPILGYRVQLYGFGDGQDVTVALSSAAHREQAVSVHGVVGARSTFVPLQNLLAVPRSLTLTASDTSCTAATGLDWSDAPHN